MCLGNSNSHETMLLNFIMSNERETNVMCLLTHSGHPEWIWTSFQFCNFGTAAEEEEKKEAS